MLREGLELMVIGMGVVFSFLVLLVMSVTWAGKLLPRWAHLFPEPDAAPRAGPSRRPPPPEVVAAAIAAAHRARHR